MQNVQRADCALRDSFNGRYFVASPFGSEGVPALGRVVMLGPPNQGSEIVDRLANVPGFGLLNGPAGKQLGTSPNDVPNPGPVRFD